jgi:hypothetical protein
MNAIIEGVEKVMRFQRLYETNYMLMRVDSKLTEMVAVIGEWVSVIRDSVQTLHVYRNNGIEETTGSAKTIHKRTASETNTESLVEYVPHLPNNSKYEPSIVAINKNEKELAVNNELLASAGETAKAIGQLTDVLKTTNSGIEKNAGVVTTAGHVATNINANARLAQGLSGELSMYETVKSAVESIGTTALITTAITGRGGVALVAGAMTTGIYEYYDELDKRQKEYAASVKSQRDRSDKTFYMSGGAADNFSNGLAEIYERVAVAVPTTITNRKMSLNPRETIKQKYGEQAYYLGYEPIQPAMDNVMHVSPIGAMTNEKEAPISKGFWQHMSPVYSALINAGETKGLNGFVEAFYNEVGTAKKYDHMHKSKTAEMVLLTGQTAFSDMYQNANKNGNNKPDIQYMLRGERTNSSVSDTGKKAITINLNRPMIEHFTVHVGNSREGVGELKKAVEEVLLEILNSAN